MTKKSDSDIRFDILYSYFADLCKPKPKLSGSQWFNKTYYLSAESSHVEGKATLYKWQEEIMDRAVDDIHREVALQKSARVGATKIIDGSVGYSIDQDPSTILVVQPTEGDAYKFAETEIEPMIRDNPHVHRAIQKQRIDGRKKREKTSIKFFKGGYVSMIGSETPRNFRMVTVRRVFVDEFDACAVNVGQDGSLVAIARKRTSDFPNGKNFWASTPLLEGSSQINKMFMSGSQAHRYVQCLECREHFTLDFFSNMGWSLDDSGELIEDSVHVACPHCSHRHYHGDLPTMDKEGYWQHAFPSRQKNISSYHIWAAYSYHFPWSNIVREYLAAEKDRSLMQGFYNLVLGLPYAEDFDALGYDALMEKKEAYEDEVPEEVVVLVMSVDTQDNRLEWLVKGFGAKRESWDIAKGRIDGDPALDRTWEELMQVIKRPYKSPRGEMIPFYTFIDRGGNKTEYVDSFCANKAHLGIYPIIGSGTLTAPVLDYKQPNKKLSKYRTPFYLLGVNRIKDTIYYQIVKDEPGESYVHFPDYDTWDEEYFKQLLSEEKDDKGRWVKKPGIKRNEAFDLQVYCYAAYRLVTSNYNIDKMSQNGKWISGYRNEAPKRKKRKIKSQVDIYD